MNGGTVNVYDAKTHFSRLLSRVEDGEEVVISRHGRPVARLVPYRPERATRCPGAWKQRVLFAPGFDDFSAADERDWYGG